MQERNGRSKLPTNPNPDRVLIQALLAFAHLLRARYPDASALIEQAAMVVENSKTPTARARWNQ